MEVVDIVKKSNPKFPCMVGTRFAPDEFEKIKVQAAEAGLSVCAYVRLRAIGGKIQRRAEIEALSDAVGVLRQVAGLMKHLHNEGQKVPYSLVYECVEAIRRIGAK